MQKFDSVERGLSYLIWLKGSSTIQLGGGSGIIQLGGEGGKKRFQAHPSDIIFTVKAFRTLSTTKALFYWTNSFENGFLHCFLTGNLLEFSRYDNLMHVQKDRSVQLRCQQKLMVNFTTWLTAKVRYFMHFRLKICRNEYWIDNNGNTGSDIETIKLVQLRYITVSWCRTLSKSFVKRSFPRKWPS